MEIKPGDFNQFWPEDVIHKGGFDSPKAEEEDFDLKQSISSH